MALGRFVLHIEGQNMTRSADATRRLFSSQGAIKESAADALRAALNPPQEPERQMSLFEIALELKRANEQFEAERQAQAEAEANQTDPGKTAAQLLAEVLSATPGGVVPLNGPGVLGIAAGAMGATINGSPA
jgi:hypothetical protein